MQPFGKCPCNRLAPLDNGWCADCRQRLHIGPGPLDAGEVAGTPSPVQRTLALPLAGPTVADLMGALVAELREAEPDLDPLAERFTPAGLWDDLARLAGEALPASVAAVLDDVDGKRTGEPEHLPLALAYDTLRRDIGSAAWLPAD